MIKDTNKPEITEAIKKQIIMVRDTGRTNMFDINAVCAIASELDLFELMTFLLEKDNHKTYVNFIISGKTKLDE